ncbi:MAG: hypothetical protein N3D73_00165 [Candidatus Diapherotrites archaeon]|nr:hypothetical protein [Candidatus Diapherotrites archaeon]
MKKIINKTTSYRHPLDNPTIRVIYTGRPKEYKSYRMAYPYKVLSERDPVFKANIQKIQEEYKKGKISNELSRKLFFEEVEKALERRKNTY